MKKVLALILAAAMAFGLVACGGGGDSSSTPAAGSGNAASTASTAGSGEKDGTLLYYCAFIGDFGLGDMGNRASLAAAEKYNLEYKLVEYGTDSSVAVNSLRDALETSTYDYVVASSWYISDVMKDIAPMYPDTTFILFDTSPTGDFEGLDNVYGITFGQNEGGFLVAVYSALMTKTGKIGCSLRSDTPILNDFGTGWLAGYKYAAKEMGLDVDMVFSYIGEDSVQSTYESCNVLFDNGADYVWSVAGTNVLGACQAAEEKGGLEAGYGVIGVDYDQWTYFKEVGDAVGYENLVTSMLKNIEPCVALIFESVIEGKGDIKPGNSFYGVATGGTGLAVNDNYTENTPKEVQDKITELSEKIASGEIDVPSYFDFNSYEAYAAYRDNPGADFAA